MCPNTEGLKKIAIRFHAHFKFIKNEYSIVMSHVGKKLNAVNETEAPQANGQYHVTNNSNVRPGQGA